MSLAGNFLSPEVAPYVSLVVRIHPFGDFRQSVRNACASSCLTTSTLLAQVQAIAMVPELSCDQQRSPTSSPAPTAEGSVMFSHRSSIHVPIGNLPLRQTGFALYQVRQTDSTMKMIGSSRNNSR